MEKSKNTLLYLLLYVCCNNYGALAVSFLQTFAFVVIIIFGGHLKQRKTGRVEEQGPP
jgi:hypothetical protein